MTGGSIEFEGLIVRRRHAVFARHSQRPVPAHVRAIAQNLC